MVTLDHKNRIKEILAEEIRNRDALATEEANIGKRKRRIASLLFESGFHSGTPDRETNKFFNAFDWKGNPKFVWIGAKSMEMATICKEPEKIKWRELKVGDKFELTVAGEKLEFVCVERPETLMIFSPDQVWPLKENRGELFAADKHTKGFLRDNGFRFVVAESSHGLPTVDDPENYVPLALFESLDAAIFFASAYAKQKES